MHPFSFQNLILTENNAEYQFAMHNKYTLFYIGTNMYFITIVACVN